MFSHWNVREKDRVRLVKKAEKFFGSKIKIRDSKNV